MNVTYILELSITWNKNKHSMMHHVAHVDSMHKKDKTALST